MFYNHFKKKQNKAFSLIELLLVVSLFTIISSFVIIGFTSNNHEHNLFLTQWLERIHLLSKEQNQSITIFQQQDGCLGFLPPQNSNNSQPQEAFLRAQSNLNISSTWCTSPIVNIFDLSKNKHIPAQSPILTIEPQDTLPAFEFKIQTDNETYVLSSINGFELNITRYIDPSK